MSRFVWSFVSDSSYRVEQVGRYELFKLVESLLQFSVVVIKSSVTVVDSCLHQSSAGRVDNLDGLLGVQRRLESKSSGKWSMLLSLRVQICLLSSVQFLRRVCRNEAVWFLYLVLKVVFSKSNLCFVGVIVAPGDSALFFCLVGAFGS